MLPGVAAPVYTGFGPTVLNDVVVLPGVAAPVYTGFEPSVSAGVGVTVQPGTAAAVYNGFEPTVLTDVTVLPGLAEVVYTGWPPSAWSIPLTSSGRSWAFRYRQARDPQTFNAMFRELGSLLQKFERRGVSNTEGVFRIPDSGFQLKVLTADPAAPVAGEVVIYALDDGLGYTELRARFATGDPQVIATESTSAFATGFDAGFG